ncbi:MAG TPA: tol-pal system protein YbgF [Syntrophorhabdaceae bacterium]|nr:tol-pal system protein YbgF [Syntrophorhabdaceae bacterium]HRR72438.1 tol-pal system protein YbgF [Syntrophorhabdaceae bacterium]HRV23342.1 tol-pal system protein YbgF [Syntrophorhabdaceae bacterium]
MKKNVVIFLMGFIIAGCYASTEDLTMVNRSIGTLENELRTYKEQNNKKLEGILKDNEAIKKQIADLSLSINSSDERIKNLTGKMEALEFQLKTYYAETKSEINALKKPGEVKAENISKPEDTNYEIKYKEAFDLFQKKMYQDAIKKFSEFIAAYAGTPLVPNAYYWLGECYMSIKDYEMAILNFNEVIKKYPKSEKAPRALLSQADAFIYLNEKDNAIIALKKVKELYPKSEEAIIADRKLKRY